MNNITDRNLKVQSKLKSRLFYFYTKNRGFLVFIFILLLIRSTFLNWNYIPTPSMNPNLIEGDFVLVNKLAYDIKLPFFGKNLVAINNPQRGDIAAFDNNGVLFVKRVMAIPGDTVKIKDNNFYINDKKLLLTPTTVNLVENNQLPYSNKYSFDTFQESNSVNTNKKHEYTVIYAQGLPDYIHSQLITDTIEFEVAEDHYFMIGDNRNLSHDSRYFGTVQRKNIVASVNTVLFNYQQLWHTLTGQHLVKDFRFFKQINNSLQPNTVTY
ncbi:MAG: signal peptidase I [Colwellia sp.]